MTKEKEYVTYQIWIKKGHKLHAYFMEMCQNAKNLYNTTNFYIRQVYTALRTDQPLQPLQQEVLHTLQMYIETMNKNQLRAYRKRVQREKEKPVKEQKEIKCNLFTFPTKEKSFLSYNFLDCLFKTMKQQDYMNLPAQTNQAVMKKLYQNWKSFFASIKAYKKHPSIFTGRPRIPKYIKSSLKEIVFTNQVCKLQDKYIRFPKTSIKLNIGKLFGYIEKLKEVRVSPAYGKFKVEIVTEQSKPASEHIDNNRYMSIDLGINNIATIITNTGATPVLVKGNVIKSMNQYYNKQKAHLLGILRHGKEPKEGLHTSRCLERLHEKRFLKIKDLFHKISYHIVQFAIQHEISMIVIGKNAAWKQNSEMGKQQNQSFCHIPHNLLIEMITYKAKRKGITVQVVEESYTSKASFLDNDAIPIYGEEDIPAFSGKRITRGLYRTKEKKLLNADVNGSYNILKKAVPKAFADGIEGLCHQAAVSTPLVLSIF
ncbi:IS200/IS605 family transposase ISBth14 [Bacillus rhizoplanae]|uniref:IS200/IS605 family transposase ISBth14 n=1 Tax=Bacillus rhizoplanae TaxID=2880966 RepID=A0ABM8Y9F4_9BACI|nr:transposase [Bacillus rhizoplanae]CAG9612376.1 IS200/IS605 family transposase ISBth14 [Bacillus rhizoplanae]